MADFVLTPDGVTPGWLTARLLDAGSLRRARVIGLEPEPIGTGQMGLNVRFLLRYDAVEPGAPHCVVGKFASSNPTSRATGLAQGAYLREVRFYQQLQATVGIRTPRCYHAAIEPSTGEFVLLLEDLAPARQGDQIEGCGVEQASLALSELAKLHAPHWGAPKLAALDWLSTPSPEAAQLLQALYTSVWPGFVERYSHALSSEQLAIAERLGRNAAAWAEGAARGPLALTHGDYRIDNMLFGSPEGGYPLAVVDWQTCAQGAPVADASYFLGASLLPELRRAHERELLEQYHAALIAEGVQGYPVEQCWADYRRFAFSGVVMAVVASMIVEQSARGDEMFIAMATRHATHALEVDAAEFLSAS
jgi:hypothetical protein